MSRRRNPIVARDGEDRDGAAPAASRRDGAPADADPVTELNPETQGSDVAEATEDQANQPGRLLGTLMLARDLWRLIRGERQRTRKLRWLLGLLRPYRGRVMIMGIALVVATVAGLAPPYLAGKAIDSGIGAGDLGVLDRIVVLYVVSALVYWARATHRPTWWAGSGSGRFRISASRSTRTFKRCRSASSRATGRAS